MSLKVKGCNHGTEDSYGFGSIVSDVYREHLSVRQIILNSDIDDSSIEKVCMQIEKFNIEDDERSSVGGEIGYDRLRNPITLYINSRGGSVYEGLAVVSAIQQSRTPVVTVAQGIAASMAFVILVAGHARYAYAHTTLMVHSIASGVYGKLQDHFDNAVELDRLQEVLDGIIIARSKVTKRLLDTLHDRKQDWYVGSEEAKALGFIDEILPMGLKITPISKRKVAKPLKSKETKEKQSSKSKE